MSTPKEKKINSNDVAFIGANCKGMVFSPDVVDITQDELRELYSEFFSANSTRELFEEAANIATTKLPLRKTTISRDLMPL